MIGTTILHYRILEKLGEGGMGIVYKAEDMKLERNVAIKFMPHLVSADTAERERFKIEAKAAAALNHPNITTVHSIEESGEETFIVMEYVDGIELSRKIKSDGIPAEEAVGIAIRIAEGLEAAHKKEIVHRDVKSQNIMITNEGNIKIMDFGLAGFDKDSGVTKITAVMGTSAYMSPEQIRGIKADIRSDIFSFGVVLYEMLTGHLPFDAEYEEATFHLILNEQPMPVEKYKADLPEELLDIISHSLQKNPDDRYQSISDVLTDLYLLKDQKSKISRSDVKFYSRVKTSKNNRLLIRLVALSIITIIFIGYYFFYNESKSPGTPINKRNSLAVMYFENLPDPVDKHHTGEMLTNLLITSLSQIEGCEVISREQLYRIFKDINLSDKKIITSKTAINVALSAGVSIILVGSILQEEPSLTVITRLIDANTGEILGSHRLSGFNSKQIFPFVDSLALLVRNDLKIRLADISGTKPVADVTTSSTEAYRAYLEGFNLEDKLYFSEAASAFRKAIELDNNFAMAYYCLSSVQEDPVESRISLQKAVELADSTTERERLLIYARNYTVQNNLKEASEIYKKIIEKYPHEIEAYNNLALISDVDINLFLRGVHTNPSAKILWDQLALTYALNNQKNEALNAINEYIRLSPAEANPYDSKGEIYAVFMNYDSSAIYYKKAIEFRKDFWTSAMKLGCYDVLQGRYEEAQNYFDMVGKQTLRYPSMNIHRGLLNSEITRLEKVLKTNTDTWQTACTKAILIHLYYETGRFSKMLRIAKKSVNEWKKIFPNDHYGRTLLVWALVKNSRTVEAEKIIEGMKKNKDESFPWVQTHALFASSILSFEEGDYESALKKFNKTFSKLRPNHEPNIFQAICLLKTGKVQDAVEQFNLIKVWPMSDLSYQMVWVPGGRFYGYINNVKAHYWLGIAYEKLGEKEKALNEYKTLIKTWKDADFDSRELNYARNRIQEL